MNLSNDLATPDPDDTARLYLALGRLWRALRRDASDSAIGHGGLSVLATLIADGPQRPSTLARIEGVTAPAMTRIVNALESFGYVVRRPDPDDGRASVVVATDTGEALVVQGRAARLRGWLGRVAFARPPQRSLSAAERLTRSHPTCALQLAQRGLRRARARRSTPRRGDHAAG